MPSEAFFKQQHLQPMFSLRMHVPFTVHPLAVSAVAFVRPRSTYCMILPLFATTGMREAAGGRQPAAAKPHSYIYIASVMTYSEMVQTRRATRLLRTDLDEIFPRAATFVGSAALPAFWIKSTLQIIPSQGGSGGGGGGCLLSPGCYTEYLQR